MGSSSPQKNGVQQWHELLAQTVGLQKYGVWKKIYHIILQNMHYAKKLDWSSARIDSSVIQAKRGENLQGPTR